MRKHKARKVKTPGSYSITVSPQLSPIQDIGSASPLPDTHLGSFPDSMDGGSITPLPETHPDSFPDTMDGGSVSPLPDTHPDSFLYSMDGGSVSPHPDIYPDSFPLSMDGGSVSSHGSSGSQHTNPGKVRPKTYMTKSRLKSKCVLDKKKRKDQFHKAKQSFLNGKFKSLNRCAKFYKVPYSTLHNIVHKDVEFCGSGKVSSVLTPEEEQLVIKHIKWRASVGCGLTWTGLQKLIQEILTAAKVSNSERVTGYENQGHMPNMNMVRRLADRHNLTLRASMEISKGRQV